MTPQLSFPRYQVSLVSIKSPGHSVVTFDTSNNNNTRQSSSPQDANVLHLTNDGESSFIGLGYLEKLHAAQSGPGEALPEIDAGTTEVQLRSRLGDADGGRVTTHRILRTARYDIIFIRHDWEGAVQQCLARRLRSKKQARRQRRSSSSSSTRRRRASDGA